MRYCTVPGCGEFHRGRGYCDYHYNRWRAYGDPLADPVRKWGDTSSSSPIVSAFLDIVKESKVTHKRIETLSGVGQTVYQNWRRRPGSFARMESVLEVLGYELKIVPKKPRPDPDGVSGP